MEMKVCQGTKLGCGQERPIEEFHFKNKKFGLRKAICRSCSAVQLSSWRNQNREKYNAWARATYVSNPSKQRRMNLKRNFGITIEQYDGILTKQDGGCAICGMKSKAKRLAVDHCHISGRIRGLLCDKHNMALGLFQDNVQDLLKAVEYLTKED